MSLRSDSVPGPPAVTYFTVADSGYFLGTVAMINSLRLTGNEGAVIVFDSGFEDWQCELLRDVATVIDLDVPEVPPAYVRAWIGPTVPGDVVVYLDSDMIVTDSLGDVVSQAASGKICFAPDEQPDRFFHQWNDFPLAGALTPRTYVNSGFLAIAPALWPQFFTRWREICVAAIASAPPLHELPLEAALVHPTGFPDQDALNAFLMSEIPADAVALLERNRAIASIDMPRVTVSDLRALDCRLGRTRTLILHAVNAPKPWQRGGWTTLSGDAYGRLLPRLLSGDDIALRVDGRDIPVWLRTGPDEGFRRAALVAGVSGVRLMSRAIPARSRRRARRRLSGG